MERIRCEERMFYGIEVNTWLDEFLLIYSVTRLGDFLHFGQPFKVGGNNYFTQITHIAMKFLWRC